MEFEIKLMVSPILLYASVTMLSYAVLLEKKMAIEVWFHICPTIYKSIRKSLSFDNLVKLQKTRSGNVPMYVENGVSRKTISSVNYTNLPIDF